MAVLIILLPLNAYVSSETKKIQFDQMKNKDARIKLINELLGGIKVLKLYAWEPIFEKQVMKIRDREIKLLQKTVYWRCAVSFVWCCAPFLVKRPSTCVYGKMDLK